MARKRNKKTIPLVISPYIWGYLCALEKNGVPIKNAYLFGSWAKGTQHKDSDIDLAIISPAFTTWHKKNKQISKAMHMDFCSVEPHGFHPRDFTPDNPVVDEVLKYGIKVI